MLKIGVISTFLPTQCGIATYVEDLIEGLKLCYPELKISKFELSDRFCKDHKETFQINSPQSNDYCEAAKAINSSNIDVLDIQHEFKIFGKPDGENVEVLLDNIKKPIATTLHTVNFNLAENRKRIFQKILRKSECMFVFSKEAKNHLVEKYHINANKFIVIPHGTPAISFRQQNKFVSKSLTFVSAGHMRDTKGYDIALKALSELKYEIPDFRYFVVGSNHPKNETAKAYRNNLLELIHEYGLQDRVTFINEYLLQNKLVEMIQLADICLLPYNRKEQSSSGVLSLMIACGRPIVTTPFQFASSYITEKSGILTETFSSDDFAKAIRILIERQNNWQEITQYNYSLGQLWNWSKVANQYLHGYAGVLEKYELSDL